MENDSNAIERTCLHGVDAAGCPACLRVMQEEAIAAEASSVALPPAGLVYWRSELRARRERAEQAARPLRWAQAFSLAALTMGALATAWWSGTALFALTLAFLVAVAACGWVFRAVSRAR